MSIVDFKSDLSLPSSVSKKPTNIVERKLDDIKRITKFMYGTTEGALFVAKQVGLQLMNPQREIRGGLFNIASGNNTRIYNLGANTLAQVAVQGTGVHLDRHGLVPVNEERSKYYKVVEENDKNGTSRLLTLYKRIIVPKTTLGNLNSGFVNTESTLESYVGGSDSVMGVGNTKLTRTFNTTNRSVRENDYDTNFTNYEPGEARKPVINYYRTLNLSTLMFGKSDILEITGVDPDRPTLTPAQFNQDIVTNVIGKPLFKQQISNSLTKQAPTAQYIYPSGDIRLKELGAEYIEKRVGFITPNGDHNIDMVNITNIYSSDDAETKDKDAHDLIKFKVELINNDNPNKTDVLVFRSYITSFEDNSSANYTPIKYVGRGDKFYVYDGYDASYSVGFDIYAMSAKEMQPIYNKLNYLKSSLAPDYSGTKMRGSLVKLTIGNYLVKVPGYINTLNISLPEDASWDIDVPFESQGGIATELPRHLKVSMTFIPIYNHLVRKGRLVPFISANKIGFLS